MGSGPVHTFEDVAELVHAAADAVGAGNEDGVLHADGRIVGRWQFNHNDRKAERCEAP